ncbi:MAG: sulfatase [Planctomycetaceae bacterium]|nr:sulfatase [Planctomycetaceae bacterium]
MNKSIYRCQALSFVTIHRLLAFFIGIAFLAVTGTGGLKADDPPNIVLIISDDQHWGDYGFMGHPILQTPRLDQLSQEGLTFTRGYVPSSLCSPSLATMITGQLPHSHKITGNDPPMPAGMQRGDFYRSQAYLDGRNLLIERMKELPTLPKRLAEKGYLSMQTGKWWMGRYDSGGFTHGMTQGDRHGDDGLQIGRETMQPIVDFLDLADKEQKPFFLWYAPMLPHDPHDPPQRLLDNYTDKTDSIHQARYWGNVERFDETCGQLFDELDRRGLSGNTVVVYVCDNGWIQSRDKPQYAPKSKQSQYDGGLRTPIMIRLPGKIQPERDDSHFVSSVDIFPTLLGLAGIPIRDTLPGINLLDKDLPGINLLDKDAVAARKAIYGECFTHDFVDLDRPEKNLRFRWMIEDGWKLIVAQPGEETGVELYNVLDDPHEERNLADMQPQRVGVMLQKVNIFYQPIEP